MTPSILFLLILSTVMSTIHPATSSAARTVTIEEHATTQLKTERLIYQWTINNFTLVLQKAGRERPCIYSPYFQSDQNDEQWYLQFCPGSCWQSEDSIRLHSYSPKGMNPILDIKAKFAATVEPNHTIVWQSAEIFVNSGRYGYKTDKVDLPKSLSPDDSVTIRCEIDMPLETFTTQVRMPQNGGQEISPNLQDRTSNEGLIYIDGPMIPNQQDGAYNKDQGTPEIDSDLKVNGPHFDYVEPRELPGQWNRILDESLTYLEEPRLPDLQTGVSDQDQENPGIGSDEHNGTLDEGHAHKAPETSPALHDPTFHEGYLRLWKDAESSDVELIVGDQKLPAHQDVLTTRSSVFGDFFAQQDDYDDTKIQVSLKNMTVPVAEAILEYIYTDRVANLEGFPARYELLAAADKYGLQGLAAMCEESVLKEMNIRNAATMLLETYPWKLERLSRAIRTFINDHRDEVMNTDDYRLSRQLWPFIFTDSPSSS